MKDTGLQNLYIFLAEKMVKNYKQGSQNILNKLKTGITIDQWVVLKYIGENNGSSQADIAKNSAKDAPTTTRIIDQLVRKKLVQRNADAKDRRKFKVMVTDKGLQLIKKVVPEILSFYIPCELVVNPRCAYPRFKCKNRFNLSSHGDKVIRLSPNFLFVENITITFKRQRKYVLLIYLKVLI